jgi:hypothetical protein
MPDQKKRVAEIRRRLKEFRKHENDAFAYSEGEIPAVRIMRNHAPEDIEFLLTEIDHLGKSKNIRVEIESEIATSKDPAQVLVYDGDKLVAKVTADVESKQGADDGFYPCVMLKNVKIDSKK